MSEPDERRQSDEEGRGSHEAPQGPPPTPFDHPLFIPALAGAAAVWFFYDAYLSVDPDLKEHLQFNRFGFRALVYATALTGMQGWAEMKKTQVPRWSGTILNALMAAWFGFDAWLNPDPWYISYQTFNTHACAGFAIFAIAHGVAAQASTKGTRLHPIYFPSILAGLAIGFGWGASRGALGADLAMYAAVGLGIMAVVRARREFRVARSAPADPA